MDYGIYVELMLNTRAASAPGKILGWPVAIHVSLTTSTVV
jgi:hypothetical protein